MRTKPLVVSGLLIADVVEICKEGMDSDKKSIPDIQPSEQLCCIVVVLISNIDLKKSSLRRMDYPCESRRAHSYDTFVNKYLGTCNKSQQSSGIIASRVDQYHAQEENNQKLMTNTCLARHISVSRPRDHVSCASLTAKNEQQPYHSIHKCTLPHSH